MQRARLPADGDAAIADDRSSADEGAERRRRARPGSVDVDPSQRKLVLDADAFRRARGEKALAAQARLPGREGPRRRRCGGDASGDAPVAERHGRAEGRRRKIVQQIQATKGKKYVEQQRSCPTRS